MRRPETRWRLRIEVDDDEVAGTEEEARVRVEEAGAGAEEARVAVAARRPRGGAAEQRRLGRGCGGCSDRRSVRMEEEEEELRLYTKGLWIG